ncbi:SGNH/GDSL hydrolase family protein [Kitasatospora sp. NPDC094019]|uniref:SGNH/GDSL hydrolase family protein n=1 Tax=Kitasatospora sp. NPDC094019 TaxID=3364091 RepID=UPI00380BF6A4
MRRPNLPSRTATTAAAVALVAMSTVLGTTTASATAAGPATAYVALGDSYSAGLGASSNYTDGACKRSTASYPALYAAAAAPASFSFQACSGATTTDVINNQLGPLSPTTTLVSLTIGGNDIGFVNVSKNCLLTSDTTCLNAVAAAENTARTALPAQLDTLFTGIRTAAPNARVVVLGYPEFYDLSRTGCLTWLNATKRAAANHAVDVLDDVLETETAKHNGFVYQSVTGAFAGHQICDTTPWLNDPGLYQGWFHPNAAGQAGAYLPAFTSAL